MWHWFLLSSWNDWTVRSVFKSWLLFIDAEVKKRMDKMLLRRGLLWSIALGFLRELFSVWKLWWKKRQRGTSKNRLYKEWSFLLPNLIPYRLQNLPSAFFFLVACFSRRNVLVWRLLTDSKGFYKQKNEERFFFRRHKPLEAKHFWSSLKLLCTSNCWHSIPYSCI